MCKQKKEVSHRYAVIFDTNAYRNLVKDIGEDVVETFVDELRQKENNKNIKCFGHVIVATEMLNHLCEYGDSAFNECYKGVIAMYHHCLDENTMEPKIIPHSKLLLCECLFQQKPNQLVDDVRNFGGIMKDVIDCKGNIDNHQKSGTFNNIKDFIKDQEKEFADAVFNTIEFYRNIVKKEIVKSVRSKNFGKTEDEIQELIKKRATENEIRKRTIQKINNNNFLENRSEELVQDISLQLDIQIGQRDCKDKAKDLREHLPLSVRFFQWICQYVVTNKTDIYSHKSQHNKWNWVWDMQVSFCSGAAIDKRKLLIVTDDGDIKEVVNQYGGTTQVMNLDEYKSFVGI